jgi:maltose O-acetyltransferase
MNVYFNSITPELIAKRKSVHELCRQFNRSPSKGNLKRIKSIFSHCGEAVFIESGFHADYGGGIHLGDRVYININCTIIDAPSTDTIPYSISIGNDCLIGPNVQFLAVSHDMRPDLRQAEKHNYIEPIVIKNNVWLGASVIVLANTAL